jgi:type VI secretion system protein ImpG
MARSNRDRLNGYYQAELDSLRIAGNEFAQAYPSIASELSLSEGEARDPHIEHLIQSFAWMMGRLRMQVEAETRKIPEMMLEELAPNFIQARPSMAIVECDVDGAGTDFSEGFVLEQGLSFAPVGISGEEETSARLRRGRFSVPYDTQLWPMKVADVISNSELESRAIALAYPSSKGSIKITLQADESASLDSLRFDSPLRFYLDVESGFGDRLYDILASRVIGVAVSDNAGTLLRALKTDCFRMGGFGDDEQLFGLCGTTELGASVLQDFFAFPDKFSFCEVLGLADLELSQFLVEGSAQIHLHLVLDDALPNAVFLRPDTFRLNCFPVINLFQKTTEPVVLHEKNYRYRLVADRAADRETEVQAIQSVYGVDRFGVRHEIKPYFSTQHPGSLSGGLYWVAQKEESQRRGMPGSDFWISVFGKSDVDVNGLSLYAKTLCNNRTLCELLEPGQQLSAVGTAPIRSCRLITRPSRFCIAELDESAQWSLLASMSRHHSALAMPDSAKDALMITLSLCAPAEQAVAQRLLQSIESFTAVEEPVPSKMGGWRGYQNGTRYTMTLNDRVFQGRAMLFGRVILHFLCLYSQVNSYSSLDLCLGSRRVYRWPPMTGQKTLA